MTGRQSATPSWSRGRLALYLGAGLCLVALFLRGRTSAEEESVEDPGWVAVSAPRTVESDPVTLEELPDDARVTGEDTVELEPVDAVRALAASILPGRETAGSPDGDRPEDREADGDDAPPAPHRVRRWADWRDVRTLRSRHRPDALPGPQTARGWSALGEELLERGRGADATDAFERALRLDPDDPDALAGRLRIALERDDARWLEVLGARLAGVSPSHPLAREALARYLLSFGPPRYARDLVPRTDRPPGSVRLGLLDAELLLAEGRPDRAVARAGEARDLDPRDPEGWIGLARILWETGSAAEAARTVETGVAQLASPRDRRRLRRDAALLRGRLESLPGRARIELARDLLREGRPERALEVLPDAEESPDAAALRVRALDRTGRREEAAGVLEDALSRTPHHPGLLEEKTRLVLGAEGPSQTSLVWAERWCEAAPDDPDALFARGYVRTSTRRPREGLEDLEAVLARTPWRSDVRVEAARAAALAREEERARGHLDEVLATLDDRPAGPSPWASHLLGRVGRAFVRLEAPEDAVVAFRRAAERDPENESATLRRARLLDRLGRRAEAIAALSDHLDGSPDVRRPELRHLLGRLLLRQDRVGRAIEHLEAARDAGLPAPDLPGLLMRAYRRAEREEAAAILQEELTSGWWRRRRRARWSAYLAERRQLLDLTAKDLLDRLASRPPARPLLEEAPVPASDGSLPAASTILQPLAPGVTVEEEDCPDCPR